MSALYDLATALHALSQRTADDKERRELVKSAVTTIRLALEKDAGDERLWNALAVLCTDGGEQVAQHAYVISLELYQKVSHTRAKLIAGPDHMDQPRISLPPPG
jgi:superkiller protein 3